MAEASDQGFLLSGVNAFNAIIAIITISELAEVLDVLRQPDEWDVAAFDKTHVIDLRPICRNIAKGQALNFMESMSIPNSRKAKIR